MCGIETARGGWKPGEVALGYVIIEVNYYFWDRLAERDDYEKDIAVVLYDDNRPNA